MDRLNPFGLDDRWRAQAREAGGTEEQLARVTAEAGGLWTVATSLRDTVAQSSGRLRRAIGMGQADRPAVGDWVLLRPKTIGSDLAMVEAVLPRRTKIARKTPGKDAREQVVAANVDVAFVTVALGRDVNEGRIERFVAIARAGGVAPVILLNKADTVEDLVEYASRVLVAVPGVPVYLVSARTGAGLEALAPYLEEPSPPLTIVLLGTSGAGKSTLLNRWSSSIGQTTMEVREDGKGRHTTTARELFLLPSGAMLIDTPGVREVGLWTSEEQINQSFEDVLALAAQCRYSDCQHVTEPSCAVRDALSQGLLAEGRVEAWRALAAEQAAIQERAEVRAQGTTRKAHDRVMAKALRKRVAEKKDG